MHNQVRRAGLDQGSTAKVSQLELDFENIRPALRQIMSVDEIYQQADQALLASLEEDRRLERKSGGYTGDSLGQYFSMWANTSPDGGIIVSGQLDKKRGFEGCAKLSADQLNRLEECGRTYCPDAKYQSKRVTIINNNGDSDFIVLFRVHYREDVVAKTINGKIFKRVADACVEIKSAEEIREIQADKGEISFEQQASGLNWPDDFDEIAVSKFVATVRDKRSLSDTLTTSDVLTLRRLGMKKNDRFFPNIACALLFAKDPQFVAPGCKVRFQRFEGDKEYTGEHYNAVKDEIIEGTVPLLIAQVAILLESQLRTFSPLVADGKFQSVSEYPRLAWYEAVVNACAHRSYGNGMKNMPIFIKMFNDRLEIESPGPFPPTVNKHNIYDTHSPRNPWLMDALFYLEYVKCAHEGTRRIRDTMAGMKLPEPEFLQISEHHVQVKVILKNDIRKRIPSIPTDRFAIDAKKGEFASKTGASNTKTEEYTADEDDDADLETLPRYLQSLADKLPAKASLKKMKRIILALCEWRELKPSEIAAYCNRQTVDHLRDVILAGFLEEGLLVLTGNKHTPQRRYKISPKGKEWLIGDGGTGLPKV